MQVVVELRYVRVRFDQAVIEIERMRGCEANALDTVDGRDEVNQGRQIRERTVRHGTGIGVYVLTQQGDLAHALHRQPLNLRQHLFEWTADFLAARVGPDA